MLIIPAIDIINGKCVRLLKGDYTKAKQYSPDPIKIAQKFKREGAKYLHVVDLDAAKIGRPVNLKTIENIIKVGIPMQVGGGIRDYKSAARLLKMGIARIILGTSAITNPPLLKKIISNFGANRIIVSIDYDGEKIAINGWQKKTDLEIPTLFKKLKEIGIKTIIVTDINRDGTLTGINHETINKFMNKGLKVIIAGGVTSMKDIKHLKKTTAIGAIIGKALYEKTISFKEAIKC